jgi:L-histidine N-alpha-methyltransferase
MVPTIDVHLTGDELADALRADVQAGLSAPPGQRSLPPKWFYDERGSKLFDQITSLPEYYPTSRERTILTGQATAIMTAGESGGPTTLVELGSGTSDKTRLLLDAGVSAGRLEEFVPFDVDQATLRSAAGALSSQYPGLRIHAVVGDFERHVETLATMGQPGQRLIAFLGSTIGNFEPPARQKFLSSVAAALVPGDQLLLGTDLVKDPRRLVAAYDDAAGVTAEFNRNVLSVINRELSADFDPTAFDHVAVWDPTNEWIEMRLRARGEQVVTVSELAMKVSFADGEELRTEVSAKFRRSNVADELSAAGFELQRWWTDPDGDFGLSLSQRR